MGKGRIITALAGTLLTATLALAAAEVMSVAVRDGQVRRDPSFVSPVVGALPYGAQVNTGEEKGAWLKVSTSQGVSGWMHLSSLSEKKIEVKAGGTAAAGGASKEELALAGKGFNKEVEADFRGKNKEANYAAVEMMETFPTVSPEQMAAFLAKGGVTPPAGGAQ